MRIDPLVKKELENMRIIDEEPLGKVVERLIEFFKTIAIGDEEGMLTDDAKAILATRLHEVREGKVLSTAEFRERLRRNRHETRDRLARKLPE